MIEFAEFSARSPFPVMDVGATYGVGTLAALKRGATVIATDLDAGHLSELESDSKRLKLETKLSTATGAFPIKPALADNSIGAVLLSRVMIFLSPELVPIAVETVHKWLVTGGKAFVTADSENIGTLSSFLQDFHTRVLADYPWPEWIPDTTPHVNSQAGSTAAAVHLLNPELLRREFGRLFRIDRVHRVDRLECPPQFRSQRGKESVVLIATKIQDNNRVDGQWIHSAKCQDVSRSQGKIYDRRKNYASLLRSGRPNKVQLAI